jgi:lysophospholipase L1-like esterase
VQPGSDRRTWQRYIAVGDSFTEGLSDPDPGRTGEFRGWADRLAGHLAAAAPSGEIEYANLAVRGRLLARIVDEQVEPAVALGPDLITISAGGNDVIRPGSDPDALAERLDPALARLAATGATLVLFTGVDVAFSPVFRRIRGKTAIYNENLRVLAAKHGALVADQWGLKAIQDVSMWAVDRLHLNPSGHHEVARMVLDVLGVPNTLEPQRPEPMGPPTWRQARTEDLAWAREYLVPWVMRRIRRTSSGDGVLPKRPGF